MMHMTFWFGYDIRNLFVLGLNSSSVSGFILICLFSFGLAIFYEALKIGLAKVKLYSALLKVPHRSRCSSDDVVLIDSGHQALSKRYFLTTMEGFTYAVELLLSYLVMLLVMTYNMYIILILLFSTGLCYFLFGHVLAEIKLKTSKLKIPCEHCIRNHPRESASSSTEIISESVPDNPSCCHLNEQHSVDHC